MNTKVKYFTLDEVLYTFIKKKLPFIQKTFYWVKGQTTFLYIYIHTHTNQNTFFSLFSDAEVSLEVEKKRYLKKILQQQSLHKAIFFSNFTSHLNQL